MNIESPTITAPTQTAEIQQNSAVSNAQMISTTDEKKSFKDELGALGAAKGNDTTEAKNSISADNNSTKQNAKTDSTKIITNAKTTNGETTEKIINPDNNQAIIANATQNNQQQIQADKNIKDAKDTKDTKSDSKDKKELSSIENPALQPLYELRAKIETINDLKNNSVSNVEKSSSKFSTDKSSDLKTIKMDKTDALFFANLVKNDTMSVASPITEKLDFTEVKSEATQKNVQVSSVLMDALADSMKTNKPFRIDFDKDIAVILKVDKEGKLTAEFIPGDKAVENYLRNNIPMLKQSFDDQNIQYSQLSYRKQQQQKEQQQQNNNQKNKENENE